MQAQIWLTWAGVDVPPVCRAHDTTGWQGGSAAKQQRQTARTSPAPKQQTPQAVQRKVPLYLNKTPVRPRLQSLACRVVT